MGGRGETRRDKTRGEERRGEDGEKRREDGERNLLMSQLLPGPGVSCVGLLGYRLDSQRLNYYFSEVFLISPNDL